MGVRNYGVASALARQLVGEAENNSALSAENWFSDLNEVVREILSWGNVDSIEIQPTALMIPDQLEGGVWDERVATWEEAQDPRVQGNWTVVFCGAVTAYTVYAHISGKGLSAILDCPTHSAAVIEAQVLADMIGVKMYGGSPRGENGL